MKDYTELPIIDLTGILDDLLNLGGLPLLAADLVLQLPDLRLEVLRLLVQLRPRLDGDRFPRRQPRLSLPLNSLCYRSRYLADIYLPPDILELEPDYQPPVC